MVLLHQHWTGERRSVNTSNSLVTVLVAPVQQDGSTHPAGEKSFNTLHGSYPAPQLPSVNDPATYSWGTQQAHAWAAHCLNSPYIHVYTAPSSIGSRSALKWEDLKPDRQDGRVALLSVYDSRPTVETLCLPCLQGGCADSSRPRSSMCYLEVLLLLRMCTAMKPEPHIST